MKNAIIGLAALAAGCATTGATQSAQSQSEQDIIHLEWMPGGTVVQAGAPVSPAVVPSSATRVEPVMENIGASEMRSSMCENSEPVITMDEHSYILQCGEYTFVHYQGTEQFDVHGNVILKAACENSLTQRITPEMEPDITYIKRWIDRDCNNVVDNYAAWEQRANRPLQSMELPEEPASDARTEVYRDLTGRINIPSIQASWEELYSGI